VDDHELLIVEGKKTLSKNQVFAERLIKSNIQNGSRY